MDREEILKITKTNIRLGYYGYASDMMKLPNGFSFRVINGDWSGNIIIENGIHYILINHPNGTTKKVEINENNRFGFVIK